MATVAITPKSVEETSPDFGMTLGAEPISPYAGEEKLEPSVQAKIEQATMAARYAQVSASNSASLATHVAELSQLAHSLWLQLAVQIQKVSELEEWKNKTLIDMRKLREEHKQLKKKYGVDLEDPKLGRSLSANVPSVVPSTVSFSSSTYVEASAASVEADEVDSRVKSAPATLESTPFLPPPGAPPGLEMPPLSRNTTGESQADVEKVVERILTPESNFSEDSHVNAEGSGGTAGIEVNEKIVDGKTINKAVWKIGRVSGQLRGCCGRALVSPPFQVGTLEDLRLMVYADKKEMHKGPRSRRQKELFNKMVSQGPLESCLKLKVPNCKESNELHFLFTVGEEDAEIRSEKITHNFENATVSEPVEFGDLNWLTKVDEKDGSITVSVEIDQLPKA